MIRAHLLERSLFIMTALASVPDSVSGKTIVLQTRMPAPLRHYLKRYAKFHGLKLEKLLTEVLQHFLALRPDLRGLSWRVPHSNRAEVGQSENWVQLNLWVNEPLGGQVAGLSLATGQSKATILYTACFWFGRYLRPPQEWTVSTTTGTALFESADEGQA